MNDTNDMHIAAERFDVYREAFAAGESLKAAALAADLTPAQRERFNALTDAFMDQAPRRPFNPSAFDRSETAETVERSLRRAVHDRASG